MANGKIDTDNRKDFCKILIDLSSSQELLKGDEARKKIYVRLEQLYNKGFRHYYSDIFMVLSLIEDEGGPSDKYSIDILGQNMASLINKYEVCEFDIEDNLRKLYDHVSLDIARIRYAHNQYEQFIGIKEYKEIQDNYESINEKYITIKEQYDSINESYEETKNKCDKIKNSYEEMNNKLGTIKSRYIKLDRSQKKITNKLNNVQREYVAILGIFAAIALSFTGGLAFSASVLDNISNVSKYRLFGTASLIGIVFINITYGLVYYVGKIVNKKLPIWPWLLVNALLCSILLLAFIFWCCNHCSAN